MEEEISNTPVPGVTESSEVTAARPLQVSAPQTRSDSGPPAERDDVHTVTSLTDRAVPPSVQHPENTGRPPAVTNEDLGMDSQHTHLEEGASVVYSRVSSLPSPEELLRDLRTRFLECVRCLSVFDGHSRGPRRLACCHALCGACLEGSRPGHPDSCPQCPTEVGSGQWRTVPDLPRVQLLEVLRLCETTDRDSQHSQGGSAELLAGVVERLLTCAICQSAMETQARAPCVLPCMHVLCAACNLRLTAHTSGRCHECRQSFTAQESAPDLFLQSLLQWLLPYREHVPSLTSQADDVTTRMYALQELLERREEQIIEQMRGEEQRQALERLLSLFGSRRRVETSGQSVHAAWKNLAETCLETIREAVKADIGSSIVVWSTAKVAYDKMLKHLSSKSGFAQALAETDAVKILTDNLRHPPFLSSTDDEHVRFVVRTSLDILHSVVEQPAAKQLFLTNNTAEAAVALLTTDQVESGLASCSARLLARLCEVLSEHRPQLLDQLGGRRFAERSYQFLESSHARCLRTDQTMWETAYAVYEMIFTYCLHCDDFARSLAEAGAVTLLTTNCRQLDLVTEISNENWSFLVQFSIQILQLFLRVDGTKQYFGKCSAVEVLPELFRCSGTMRTLLLSAIIATYCLIQFDREGWRQFGEAVAETGFADKISGFMRINRDVVIDRHRVNVQRLVSSVFSFSSGHSNGTRKALVEGGFVKLETENLRFLVQNGGDEEMTTGLILDTVGFLLMLSWEPTAPLHFQRNNTVQALEPFLHGERDVVLRQAAFMSIVNVSSDPITNETELTAETVSSFRSALASAEKRFYGKTHMLYLVYFYRAFPLLAERRDARAQLLKMSIIPDLDRGLEMEDAEIRDLAALGKAKLLS